MSRPKRQLMAAPIMGINGATKSYGPVEALKAVNVNIKRGQVHAVVGENGAGKSTLIGIAAGVTPADFVIIRVSGKEIKRPKAKKLRRAGIAVTFQNPAVAKEMITISPPVSGCQSSACSPIASSTGPWPRVRTPI